MSMLSKSIKEDEMDRTCIVHKRDANTYRSSFMKYEDEYRFGDVELFGWIETRRILKKWNLRVLYLTTVILSCPLQICKGHLVP
jgi:hypothetical protein